MAVFIFILYILLGVLFGWMIADVMITIERGDTKKSWKGLVLGLIGILYVAVGCLHISYSYEHRTYDYKDYKIVNDTTITNHNGQIDTIATFKIMEK